MIEQKPLVSVIVPIYNLEKYVNKCIASILNQTYKKLELLLIDDGSTDSSASICQKWLTMDNRVKYFYKSNGGVGSARNLGIDISNGEYICFVDGDDWLEEEFICTLMGMILNYNVDIAECCANYCYENHKKAIQNPSKKNKFTPYEYLTEVNLKGHYSYSVVWGKMYKKKLFNGIRFSESKKNAEDQAFTYKVIYESNAVFRCNDCLYNYRQRSTGASKTAHSLRFFNDTYSALEEKIAFFNDRNERNLSAYYKAKLCLFIISEYKNLKTILGRNYFQYYKYVCKSTVCLIGYKCVPLKYKIYIMTFVLFPYLF